ncbi:MAG: hypothetical protein ACREVZ_04720 [Burkholderiales bacterium]
MSYDSPNYTVRNEQFSGEAGGGATTEYMRFRRFQKMRIKAVHAVVTVAGTTTGHGFDIYHGTTSKGTLPVLGTSAAGVTASNATIDFDVASLEQVSVKSLADATGKAHIVYEYENTQDGVVSA